ncbi:hypothetical protein Tco_1307431, partial [Tanacetum coccineum]
MAANQAIEYAPQCGDLTVESLTFNNNNIVSNFSYLQTTLAYHDIFKYLMNCSLAKAFTKTPSVVYQNLLREFWCTAIAYDPNPPTDDSEVCPLKEYLIMFLMMNGKKPLTLGIKTFTESTRLDYENDTYVSHPSTKEVLGGNYSSTEQVNSIHQLFAYCLLTGIKVDIGEIIYMLLGPDYTQDESFWSSPTILSNYNFSKDLSKVTPIELTDFIVDVNKCKHSVNPLPFSIKKKKGKSQTMTLTLTQSQGHEALGSLPQKMKKPKSKKTPTETKVTPPKPMKGSEQSHSVSSGTIPDPKDPERNIQLAGENVQPVDRGLPSTVSDEGAAKTTSLPKGLHGDKNSEGLKPPIDMEPQTNPVDDPSGNDAMYQPDQTQSARLRLTEEQWEKHEESAISYADLKASIEGYYEENDAVKHDLALNKKDIEATKAYIKHSTSLTELLTLNVTSVVTKEPPAYTEGETKDIKTQDTNKDKVEKEQVSEEPKHVLEPSIPQREEKGIAIDGQPEQTKLVKVLSIVCPDLKAIILVPYMINGKLFYLTNEQCQAHLDKEDQIKKAEEEAKRLAMTKTEVIKIVQEKAEKIGIDPKKVISAKAGEKFKKAQDAEMQSEPITDVKIHPNSKPTVLTVYKNNDKMNFDVHNPFKFADFGITELDELGPIIQKKKNTIVKDLMKSLGKRYERLKKIPKDLGIQSALPAHVPKKDQSQSLGRKKKHMELEPEIKVP